MRHIYHLSNLLATVVYFLFLTACGDDYSDDIDKLNSQYTTIEQRVTSLESQVSTVNKQLGQLSVLAYAVEQGFYITSVKTTGDTYELTLSNGHVIVLQKGEGNMLVPMPAVSMTMIDGFYYWTVNGMLFMGDDGKPVRSDGTTPIVRYDYVSRQWVISIDGGTTFKDINTYVSVVINDKVLLQVINNYIRENSTTLISQNMLFQIISTYIQQNYASLFNVQILDEVVATYTREHYTKIFNYELLEKIFTQYNFSYITGQIDVNRLTNILITFIREHEEIFINNEVLTEIISSYFQVNKTTIFTNELLLEVINNFIENHSSYINVELLTMVVNNYIDQHSEEVFNTVSVQNLILEYIQRNYVQIFSQEILTEVINNYMTVNRTTIFNQKLIREIVSSYIQNNYKSIFTDETVYEIINNYVTKNASTLIDREVLIEVITNYFEKNYNLFVDKTVIRTAVNTYIEMNFTTLIDVDFIWQIINRYLEQYYYEVFSYDMLTTVVQNYFEQNTQIITEYVGQQVGLIRDVIHDGDVFSVTLSSGQNIQLMVYDAYSRLRDRVQSIVIMPDANGHVKENSDGNIVLKYLVSPAAMANVILNKYNSNEMTVELLVTDANSNVSTINCRGVDAYEGVLSVGANDYSPGSITNMALHVKENKTGGTDIMTEFTPVDFGNQQPGNYTCPDDHHPHMIDLGLPSGTKWACCNVDASKPEDYGGYYAWGETKTKNVYSLSSYQYYSATGYYQNIGTSICGTNYDVAHVKWGDSWQMPSAEQCKELIEYCTFSWSAILNTNGCWFTGKNGGKIFLPAAGLRYDSDIYGRYSNGFYWSGTVYPNNLQVMYSLYFTGHGYVSWYDDNYVRYGGRPVRPVVSGAVQYQPLTLSTYSLSLSVGELKAVSITSGSGSYTIQSSNSGLAEVSLNGNTIKVTGAQQGSFYITVTDTKSGQTATISVTITANQNGYLTCPDSHHPHMIDLGLPSGTLWACCNVDASSPEDLGGFYAWGETKTKDVYTWKTYQYSPYGNSENLIDIGDDIAGTKYDVATEKWGKEWRMPTHEQMHELFTGCPYAPSILAGVEGRRYTGTNGGTIFIPASNLNVHIGEIWTSTLTHHNSSSAYSMYFGTLHLGGSLSGSGRYIGHNVRPVAF